MRIIDKDGDDGKSWLSHTVRVWGHCRPTGRPCRGRRRAADPDGCVQQESEVSKVETFRFLAYHGFFLRLTTASATTVFTIILPLTPTPPTTSSGPFCLFFTLFSHHISPTPCPLPSSPTLATQSPPPTLTSYPQPRPLLWRLSNDYSVIPNHPGGRWHQIVSTNLHILLRLSSITPAFFSFWLLFRPALSLSLLPSFLHFLALSSIRYFFLSLFLLSLFFSNI